MPDSSASTLNSSTPETPVTAGGSALLGITAKSIVRRDRAARATRYAAQSQARVILGRVAAQIRPGAYAGDVFRTVDCRHSSHGSVQVNYARQHRAAHYSGLVTCGSVWACPICAAKIQERRRGEIDQAIAWAAREGLQPIMVTFTFPHRSFDALADLLQRQARAFPLLRQTARWRKLKVSMGYRGLIRSLEVTHGQNGWHPHTHELWFVDPSVTVTIKATIAELWLRACTTAGLVTADTDTAAFLRHSVDVRLDATAGQYLAKQDDSRSWGMSHEIAKASSKAGRAKGVHPHHFLVRNGPGDADRFVEYVQGMKGRRQLFWSHGLKDLAQVDEASDEEVAAEQREPADVLGRLSPEAWKAVRGVDARAELLDAAETGGWPAVVVLLRSIGFDPDRDRHVNGPLSPLLWPRTTENTNRI